jgi:hypothetical protein
VVPVGIVTTGLVQLAKPTKTKSLFVTVVSEGELGVVDVALSDAVPAASTHVVRSAPVTATIIVPHTVPPQVKLGAEAPRLTVQVVITSDAVLKDLFTSCTQVPVVVGGAVLAAGPITKATRISFWAAPVGSVTVEPPGI